MTSVLFNKGVTSAMTSRGVGCGEAAYHITVTRKDVKKPKRIRSAFTTDQVQFLEEKYKKHPYIDNLHRKEVSKILNITERSVKIWFQNRRMREKNENKTYDFNIFKNSPNGPNNGRLSNSPTSTNRTPLPSIMTPDVTSNVTNTEENISLKIKPLDAINKETFKCENQQKTNEENERHVKVNPLAQYSKVHRSSSKSNTTQNLVTSSLTRPKLPKTEAGQSPYHINTNSNIPKPSGCSNSYFYPGYVGSTAIWRPVDVVPVVSTNPHPVLSAVQRPGQERTACSCNCCSSRNAGMIGLLPPQKIVYPYPQFMFTAIPFPNPKY